MSASKKLRAYWNDLHTIQSDWGWEMLYRLRLKPLWIHYMIKGGKGDRLDLEFEALTDYLINENQSLIDKYQHEETVQIPIGDMAPIWICWWQGEELMPELVSQCYKLLKQHCTTHPVKLLTKDNYQEHIELPPRIMTLFQSGTITMPQFSDIMRMYLVSTHGGIWIDSTYWIIRPFDISSEPFISVKSGNEYDPFIPRGRWSGNFVGGAKRAKYFRFMYEALINYWNRHECLINYFLIDYFTQIAYTHFPDVKEQIDLYARCCPNLTALNMNEPYDESRFMEIIEKNNFLKLSWKWQLRKQSDDGTPTVYRYFLSL